MKKRTFSALLILGMTLGSMVSCSKLEDTAKNAQQATVNSGLAAQAAGESREEIANGRMMTRSGSSSESRREALDGLMRMETLAMKITEASKYVKAFEFQLWTGQKYDTAEYLDQMYEDAMEEFFRSLYELNGDESIARSELSPFKLIGKGKSYSLNIYAISLAMHGIHNVQELVTAPRENAINEACSIYELIKQGLKKAELVESGKLNMSSLKEYEKTVYDYRDDAKALIQARYNGMLTLSIARLSSIKDNKMEGLKTLFIKKSFDSKFSELNIGQQYQLNVYLDAAIKVKKFMKEINMVPEVIPTLQKLYGKMVVKDYEDGDVIVASELKMEEYAKYRKNLAQMFIVENNRLQVKTEE